jgi:hypothetical protein
MSRPTLAQSSQPNNVYTTLADVRNALQIEDSLDDNDIQAAILAASRMIDEYCQRSFYQEGTLAAPVTKYYTPLSPWYLEIDDLIEPTEVRSRANHFLTAEILIRLVLMLATHHYHHRLIELMMLIAVDEFMSIDLIICAGIST